MSNLATYCVGIKAPEDSQFDLIYCNGIESSPEQAQEQASIISNAFNGREVTIIYNPTKVNGYFNFGTDHQLKSEKTIADFLRTIVRKRLQDTSLTSNSLQNRVALFAHSHGTAIVAQALMELPEKDQVHVYAFGGFMIAKKWAKNVENYFNEGDLIGKSGNQAYDSAGILQKYLKIRERAKKEGFNRAIVNQVKEDTLNEIDPMIPGANSRALRQQKFVATFFSGQEVDRPLRLVKEYTQCFTDYNIHILPSPLREPEKLGETPMNSDELAKIAAREMKSYVTDSDAACHKFPNFKNQIEDIAKNLMQQEQRN